jgi:hypothetical protein
VDEQAAEAEPAGGEPLPAGGTPQPTESLDIERLAAQIAERVYRLMLAEARLSRARGQRRLPLRHAQVRI